jgi:hypothetical protein
VSSTPNYRGFSCRFRRPAQAIPARPFHGCAKENGKIQINSELVKDGYFQGAKIIPARPAKGR